jgi:hypothetical protein
MQLFAQSRMALLFVNDIVLVRKMRFHVGIASRSRSHRVQRMDVMGFTCLNAYIQRHAPRYAHIWQNSVYLADLDAGYKAWSARSMAR